jgi:hypothetical protein
MAAYEHNLATDVIRWVYTPAVGAYGLVTCGGKWIGTGLYVALLAGATWLGMFRYLRDWPNLAKFTLAVGPSLIASAFVFDFGIIGLWFVPVAFFALVLNGCAYFALRKANLEIDANDSAA